MEPLTLKAKRLNPLALLPKKSFETDSCYDLYALNVLSIVPARSTVKVGTGVAIALPPHHGAFIWTRSGMAMEFDVQGGVIDNKYRGEWVVMLHNTTAEEKVIRRGDRIAQFVVQLIPETKIEEVNELDETDRGTSGFGSTGR